MMRYMTNSVMTFFLLLFSLVACTNQAESTTSTAHQPTLGPTVTGTDEAPDDSGLNILIEGNISLRRASWDTDYYDNAPPGTILGRGDLFRLADGAAASILCNDLSIRPIPSGVPSGLNNICPPSRDEPLLTRDGIPVSNTRSGGFNLTIPFIISPRATTIRLDAPLTLRWNETGAQNYIVRVQRGSEVIWEKEVTGAVEIYAQTNGNLKYIQVDYDGPALYPGNKYKVFVEINNGKSSQDENLRGLEFELLDQGTEADIDHKEKDILALSGLSTDETAFALSQWYAAYGLISEAIRVLEDRVEVGTQEPAVYLALGDLYLESNLLLLAEARYRLAEQYAASEGALEMQAAAQAGLGEALKRRGVLQPTTTKPECGDAVCWFGMALDSYKALGDTLRADNIQVEIDALPIK